MCVLQRNCDLFLLTIQDFLTTPSRLNFIGALPRVHRFNQLQLAMLDPA
jgi:hypothetical protein